jgi:hypothetical protein
VSQATLNTILAGIAAFTGVVGIWLSIRHNRERAREREEDRQLSEEQLRLAQEQAARLPSLEVSDVLLLEIKEVADNRLHELVRETEEERAEEERTRREYEARLEEIQRRSPPYARDVERWSLENEFRLFLMGDRMGDRYEGPLPDKVVRVSLVNRGKIAAFEITGTFRFEAAYLEPLGYFTAACRTSTDKGRSSWW